MYLSFTRHISTPNNIRALLVWKKGWMDIGQATSHKGDKNKTQIWKLSEQVGSRSFIRNFQYSGNSIFLSFLAVEKQIFSMFA